jgi:hypothetical protein
LGWQLHSIESIDQPSSPQLDADASVAALLDCPSASFALAGCVERRFFESGAHTTRQLTEQSTGTVHVFVIVKATAVSPLSA